MYKIGVLGDRDSILGFMALGYSVVETAGAEDAAKKLTAMVRSEEYGVIFVVDTVAEKIEETMNKYKDNPLPAIVPIPGQGGNSDYGMNLIRTASERAIGADILFKD